LTENSVQSPLFAVNIYERYFLNLVIFRESVVYPPKDYTPPFLYYPKINPFL